MDTQQAALWYRRLPVRFLLPLLIVLTATSAGSFVYSEALLERVILEQVKKQAEVFLLGLEQQIQLSNPTLERIPLEEQFVHVLAESHQRYSFSVEKIYLYLRSGEVVAHSDRGPHLPKGMEGRYGEVFRSGRSHLAGAIEEKSDPLSGRPSRYTDIIIPVTIGGQRVAALEAELNLSETETIIASVDEEFESMIRLITLISTVVTALLFLLMLWTQLIRPAKAYERALQRSVEEGRALNRAKDDFLSSMSHELRTPLTTIIGYHQFMVAAADLPAHYREMVEESLLAGKTLQQLVNDILDMSKIRAGKFQLDPAPFNLQRMLLDIVRLMESYNPERAISLRFTTDEAVEPLLQYQWIGDEMRISQLLFNLLSNAIKFSPESGEVAVQLRLCNGADCSASSRCCFEIEVKDHGAGISEQALSRLFTPFEQEDGSTSRRYGGTGLGLYITQQLVRMMGGEIKVSSRVGEGSTFSVQIPMERGERVVSSVVSAAALKLPPLLQGRVLVADDTPSIQRLVRLLVEQTGASVTVVKSGVEALEQGRQGGYQLILMDMQMPLMDGIEATQALRDAGSDTPIAALTANAMQQHRDAFERAGCDRFLAKPIEPSHLYEVLMAYLRPATDEHFERSAAAAQPSNVALLDQQMMDEFWEDLLELEQALQEGYQQRDWSRVADSAHTIKGMGSSFGQPELTQLAAKLNHAAEQQEAAIALHLDALVKKIDQQNPLR